MAVRTDVLSSLDSARVATQDLVFAWGVLRVFGPEYAARNDRAAIRSLANNSDEKWLWNEHIGAKHAVPLRVYPE
jgi:hypothetical protein